MLSNRSQRPLACWDRWFESHRGHGCLSVVSVVCWQVESYRMWCVTVCDIETSSMRSQHQSIVTEFKDRRYITGCISCMPLIVTVNTIAECPRKDCNIYWEEKMLNARVALRRTTYQNMFHLHTSCLQTHKQWAYFVGAVKGLCTWILKKYDKAWRVA